VTYEQLYRALRANFLKFVDSVPSQDPHNIMLVLFELALAYMQACAESKTTSTGELRTLLESITAMFQRQLGDAAVDAPVLN
jgi:hypothetical protein